MTFEQLNKHLEETLSDSNVPVYNDLQTKTIAKIKQGGDAVIIAPAASGKTTAIAFGSIVKAPDSYEGSPRVIIYSSTVDKAHQLQKQLTEWVRRTEISVEMVHDKGNMIIERNNVFDGADILIANPKRLLDMYIQNGFHVGQLKMIVIDDADEIAQNNISIQHIARLVESFPKTQRLIFAKSITPKMEKLIEIFCNHPQVIEIEE